MLLVFDYMNFAYPVPSTTRKEGAGMQFGDVNVTSLSKSGSVFPDSLPCLVVYVIRGCSRNYPQGGGPTFFFRPLHPQDTHGVRAPDPQDT